jgi:hypothetical protein
VPLALGSRKRGGDVIHIRQATSPQIDRLRAVRGRRAGLMHSDESPPQGFVHQFLERLVESPPQLLDPSRDIVVEG